MARSFRSVTLIVLGCVFVAPLAAYAGPARVVILRDGYLGPKAATAGKPYIVMQKNASVASLNDKRIDLDASRQYCAELVAQGLVKEGACEPDGIVTISVSPNDPRASQQYAIQKTSLLSAWDTTTGTKSVKVAIIDTGIQYTHPDLNANMWMNSAENFDGIDNDGNGFIDDVVGYDFVASDSDPNDENDHGTHCAGIAAGIGNNATGIAGGAWKASIMAVRVLDANGSGFLSDVASGVRYAADNGASVLSLSLGGSGASQALEDALRYACDKGALIVAAAGNESANNDVTPSYPANYNLPCLISIAATDSLDALADFSNFGSTTVHLAAPGVDILSTLPGSNYGLLSGTSMATPLVAGIGVLVKSAKPELSGADIKTILMQSADKISSLEGRISTGGRVNAANALAVANGTNPSPPAPTPTPIVGEPSDPDDPEDDPESGDDVEQAIEFEKVEVQTSKGRGIVSGYLYELESEFVVSGEFVSVSCTDRRGALIVADSTSKETDEEGYFQVRLQRRQVNKLSRGGTCFAGSRLSEEYRRRIKVRR